MLTLKIKAHISSSHRIEIQLTNDTPEGDEVLLP